MDVVYPQALVDHCIDIVGGMLKTLSPNQISMMELAGEPIRAKLTAAPGNNLPFGGIKVIAENGWFAARPSGTEDIYKIYAESFRQ